MRASKILIAVFLKKHGGQKAVGWNTQNVGSSRGENVKQEFYTQQNHHSHVKEKLRISI